MSSKFVESKTSQQNPPAFCKTNGDVNNLCMALNLAQNWRIGMLQLPNKLGAEGWAALNKAKVNGRGRGERIVF